MARIALVWTVAGAASYFDWGSSPWLWAAMAFSLLTALFMPFSPRQVGNRRAQPRAFR
jgi:FtsH-binding integral membrane protein